MTRAGTAPLHDIQWVRVYFNTKRLRSTKANLRKMLQETGGDCICNAAIFLARCTRLPITGRGPSAGTPRRISA